MHWSWDLFKSDMRLVIIIINIIIKGSIKTHRFLFLMSHPSTSVNACIHTHPLFRPPPFTSLFHNRSRMERTYIEGRKIKISKFINQGRWISIWIQVSSAFCQWRCGTKTLSYTLAVIVSQSKKERKEGRKFCQSYHQLKWKREGDVRHDLSQSMLIMERRFHHRQYFVPYTSMGGVE